jgi:branched-chain amino acid aminotransferase
MLRRSSVFYTFYAKDLDLSKVLPAAQRPPMIPMAGVGFGTKFAPHMAVMDYDAAQGGWQAPAIVPFAPMAVDPAATGLQYSMQCFEGMKAYRDRESDVVRLFRPDMNGKRLLRSFKQLAFPEFAIEEFTAVLNKLVSIDRDWVPTEDNHSLYIRPTGVGMSSSMVPAQADKVRMFIISSPVGPYYATGFKPVKLYVENKNRRAWPGEASNGCHKLGGNYAGPIYQQVKQGKEGFGQILWLGPNKEVDEVGAMNFMVLWKNENGERELMTAPLDGTILPGVTRDSILTLTKEWGEFKVSERRFTIDDLVTALKAERVEEMFGCGTAAIVTSVNGLQYEGADYAVPCPDNSVTMRVMRNIVGIQTGKIQNDAWSKVVE